MTYKKTILAVHAVLLFPIIVTASEPRGFELVTKTWEKGVSEIRLRTTHATQTSGSTAETDIVIRFPGVLQQIRGLGGNLTELQQNESGTIVGVNLRPATEVNQIYLVIKAVDGQLHVFQNLNLIIAQKLVSIRPGLLSKDADDFFLTEVGDNNVTVEYRGSKKLNPSVHPFIFRFQVSNEGLLAVDPNSIKEL